MNIDDPVEGTEYAVIRPDILESLKAYVRTGRPVGGFLTAVLSNDLSDAIATADEHNLRTLPTIVRYVYNRMPSLCWHSESRVQEWMEHGGLEGIKGAL